MSEEINQNRRRCLNTAAATVAAADLEGAIGWLNSVPLSHTSLRGRVVLVDFWTYTCINCLRPLPNVKSWAAKYKDVKKCSGKYAQRTIKDGVGHNLPQEAPQASAKAIIDVDVFARPYKAQTWRSRP
jgi:thiol-disulfide isomerase/thioredoxin